MKKDKHVETDQITRRDSGYEARGERTHSESHAEVGVEAPDKGLCYQGWMPLSKGCLVLDLGRMSCIKFDLQALHNFIVACRFVVYQLQGVFFWSLVLQTFSNVLYVVVEVGQNGFNLCGASSLQMIAFLRAALSLHC